MSSGGSEESEKRDIVAEYLANRLMFLSGAVASRAAFVESPGGDAPVQARHPAAARRRRGERADRQHRRPIFKDNNYLFYDYAGWPRLYFAGISAP